MATHFDIAPGRRPGAFSRLAGWWGPRPLAQVAVIVAVIALFYGLGSTIAASMARIGISPGFDFLWRSANFEIGEQAISFRAGDTYARAMLVGVLNTLKVALLGCVLATVLGVFLGVAGLSGNLLLAGIVRWYIEIVRNTPLLLQLFFWISVAKALPAPRQALTLFDAVFLSGRGIYVPGPVAEGASVSTWLGLAVVVTAFVGALVVSARRSQLGLKRALLVILGAFIAAALVFRLSGASVQFEVPRLAGFNIRGGWSLSPEFAALLTGLTVKFSASIAEIVRAGIESVKQGQWEAARALGLHDGQIMRLVVLPQALRVITPLTTSNYLDLTKDSSLAVAIGYPDLVSVVNTTANTTGQAFEALIILIAVYLTLNLVLSALMNIYNNRVALRGGGPA
jgi:general L-amino acid transport system permease protein